MFKRVKKSPLICVFTLILLLFTAVIGVIAFNAPQNARADEEYSPYKGQYTFYFKEYDVTYDVAKNREIKVTEKLTVTYTGYDSTGFIKYIPVNGGEQVRDIKVSELTANTETFVPYNVYTESVDDAEFICVDIGDYTNKTDTTHTYLIEYGYNLTKAQEGRDVFYLNAIGVDRQRGSDVLKANVTLILPDGYKQGYCYVGSLYSENKVGYDTFTASDGRTAVKLENAFLNYDEGVTFELLFEEGALSTYFDFTPLWFALAGLVILAVLFIVKTLRFNKSVLTPIVNFEAPDKMDPLIMGKLIDNKVDNEDITSMLFYWADKGYLKINLDNQNDPALIRVVQKLPDGVPEYESYMFYKLFGKKETVRPSQLANSFYTTADSVKSMVNKKAVNLYTKTSNTVAILFAVLGALILAVTPIALTALQISAKLISLVPFIAFVPCIVIYLLGLSLKYYSLKLSNKSKTLYGAGIALLCVIVSLVYALALPNWVAGFVPKFAVGLVGCAVCALSVMIVSRTDEYTEKLNDIIGFKNFITLAEKERLEALLEDDPQFYYHILPYAQVLGVSDKWEEKFEDITVPPPDWSVSSAFNSAIHFHIMNNIIRSSLSNISRQMVSRPSSSGGSGRGGFGGSFGGGGGGGHVGGGHGGGGFHGR